MSRQYVSYPAEGQRPPRTREEAEVAKADLDRRRAAAARLHGEEAASSKPGRRGGVREEE